MARAHTELVEDILVLLSRFPRLGMFWPHPTGAGLLTVPSGRSFHIKYGLKGSPDIVGMLGNGHATFCGIECKTSGDILKKQQLRFRARSAELNAIYLEARSADQVLKAIEAICAQ